MRTLLLSLLAMTSIACSHAKTKPTVVQAGCVTTPPPVTAPLPFKACPDGLTVCLDQPGALVLRDNIRRMKDWIDTAWLRCGTLTR